MSLLSWNKTNSIMVPDLFNVLLNSVCKYFDESFCGKLVYNFLSCYLVLVSAYNWLYSMSLGAFLPFLFHGIAQGALVLALL
jgi:hypothetical protein